MLFRSACNNLGISGVPLYPGTKHSTVTAAKEQMSPEEIKKYLTGHKTNKAFDRYLLIDAKTQREATAKIRKGGKTLAKVFNHPSRSK